MTGRALVAAACDGKLLDNIMLDKSLLMVVWHMYVCVVWQYRWWYGICMYVWYGSIDGGMAYVCMCGMAV